MAPWQQQQTKEDESKNYVVWPNEDKSKNYVIWLNDLCPQRVVLDGYIFTLLNYSITMNPIKVFIEG